MTGFTAEVSVNGESTHVPAIEVDGALIVAGGRFPRIASIRDESFVEAGVPHDPARLIAAISGGPLRADVLTFPQHIDEPTPKYPYYSEQDNVAAAPTSTFAGWWDRLPQSTRKNVRRAERRGVITKAVALDERLAEGIKGIYDETPTRQGRRFWHYGKDVDRVFRENSSYLERSEFVGAYHGGQLIGFVKLVYVGRVARIMQLLSLVSHYDKRPMNALIAKAVELCSEKGMSHLVYSKFQYGNKTNTPLMEFKTRNGFEQMNFPRYFVPLTLRGKIAVACRLHRGALGLLPSGVIANALRLRESLSRSLLSGPAIPGPGSRARETSDD